MKPKYWAFFLALVATLGAQSPGGAQGGDPKAASERCELFHFEEVKKPDPNQIVPRKWNWEIRLSAAQSQRRFRIVQRTMAKKSAGSERDTILFSESDLQRAAGDVIHFRLHTGDENPTRDMNSKGNTGLGVSFARLGGGYGASSWIVMPGRVVKSHVSKQDYLRNGELLLVSIETIDAEGKAYLTDVKLQESN